MKIGRVILQLRTQINLFCSSHQAHTQRGGSTGLQLPLTPQIEIYKHIF